jgi:hypothetical protein
MESTNVSAILGNSVGNGLAVAVAVTAGALVGCFVAAAVGLLLGAGDGVTAPDTTFAAVGIKLPLCVAPVAAVGTTLFSAPCEHPETRRSAIDKAHSVCRIKSLRK